jgi:general secretion pathway protein A
MYCEHFGFSEKPFNVTPDPTFLYLSPDHEQALTTIIYGIQERQGLITVVGDVGTGKTTILNTAFEWLSQKTKVAYLSNFDLNFEEMLKSILYELALVSAGDEWSKVDALYCLNEFSHNQLFEGGNVAVVVDDAHNLDASVLENLRLLSNMETQKHQLIQIVLCGQPELDSKLAHPGLSQLKQRVGLRTTIKPLGRRGSYEYIRHRTSIAHQDGSKLFNSRALDKIYTYSAGVPRKINVLCDNALLTAYKRKHKIVGKTSVEKAAMDLNWTSPSKN